MIEGFESLTIEELDVSHFRMISTLASRPTSGLQGDQEFKKWLGLSNAAMDKISKEQT